MITVRGHDWNTLRSMLSDAELVEIKKVTFAESLKPRSVTFDEERLKPELTSKLKILLGIKS